MASWDLVIRGEYCHDLFHLWPFWTPFWTSELLIVMFWLTFVSYLFNPAFSPVVYSTWLPGAYFLMTLCSVLTCCLFHLYPFTCLTLWFATLTLTLIKILLHSIKDMQHSLLSLILKSPLIDNSDMLLCLLELTTKPWTPNLWTTSDPPTLPSEIPGQSPTYNQGGSTISWSHVLTHTLFDPLWTILQGLSHNSRVERRTELNFWRTMLGIQLGLAALNRLRFLRCHQAQHWWCLHVAVHQDRLHAPYPRCLQRVEEGRRYGGAQ